jgi:hypothetical protein
LAHAATIYYTEQATATGSLGSDSFTSALVTITFVGDTANAGGSSGFFTNSIGAATVTIAGIGTATFDAGTVEVFDNQTFSPAAAVGMTSVAQGHSILDTLDAAFASYELTTAIGPVTDSSLVNSTVSTGTNLG